MAEDYRERLQNLLKKLFQFDSADLDFGIYRIMNRKRDHIEHFIQKDLIDAVDAEFAKYSESKQANLKEEVEKLKVEILEKLGEDAFDENEKIRNIYVTTPFAKELSGKYEEKRTALANSDMTLQHKAEIFSHIYQFFSRYYDNGDFMSLRRYSQKEKYAIPYNGEEVVLHWANKDQYYIKTGECFKNYSFKMGEYTVEFRILEAEGTINNNKSENRFFVPSSSDSVYDPSKKLLTIFFEHRGLSKDEEKEYGTKDVQDAIITKMKDAIPSQVQDSGLKAALNKIVDKETEKTVLEKHLRAYTQRNTTDYFIHKDLKGFLTRELDFYIKNEVFHLDDLGTENEAGAAQYMSRVSVIKSICLKIIDFLAQIEDFQKMLFEKKKFVVRTDYCMTIDNVPPELYPEILKNKDQLNEWKILYGAGEEKQSSITSFRSKSIDEEYLKEHPYLVLDTKFFDREFKDRLLASPSFDDLDEAVGGLMIKSENWQALNLMQEKYREKVKCIYIDPPYNTSASEILYKNNYKHSSWLSLTTDRIAKSISFLKNEGIIEIAIDDFEGSKFQNSLDAILGFENRLGNIVIVHNPGGRHDDKFIATAHEYCFFYGKNVEYSSTNFLPLEDEDIKTFKFNDGIGDYRNREFRRSGNNSTREARPKMFYPLLIKESTISLITEDEYHKIYDKTTNMFNDSFLESLRSKYEKSGYEFILPVDPRGILRVWRWTPETLLERVEDVFADKNGESYIIKVKDRLDNKPGLKPKSVWYKPKYTAALGTNLLKGIFGQEGLFSYPKSINTVIDCLRIGSINSSTILDFFAGSGTTAHAVLNLNKEEDDGYRKYILIEMGDYFDTVMKPRIQKVMYSDNWKDGSPQSNEGISHIFKYQYLEQYEDTLSNVEFKDAGSYQRTLSEMNGYFLRYMLDFETRDSSPCRFNVEKLTKPFDYTLRITHGNELKDEKIDLVETFNYLLGIHVRQIRTFNNGTYYRVVFGRKNEDGIAIIWRDTEKLDLKADKAFIEGTILSGIKPSKVYINADFYVEGALPIEPEFKKLMVV
ncbi:MAG: site-specific DNA-methyltransferase [Candidatus Methanoperedens sp.]|nr:site-specific DNA-methyltransferase [Candidatus Methanoperedens sp.]